MNSVEPVQNDPPAVPPQSQLRRGAVAALPWLFSLLTAALFYLLIPGSSYVLAGAVAGLVMAYLWAKP
ncbi:MAG: hypothetical protein P0Y58_14230 [Candidatus Pseudomonas phytovorans]|uniref:Uncharacterized protein n=1 Tax=Candidatus Pseudomonas phytovorans TaxID=3121377 RepID=A0AAJ6B8X8_9PSED|nr:hypothetical protein [Pseudomonas sp.]WEK28068.1 MAG: hypothetical protein P0Y58_14230 [Pseudomonas sp.]